MSEPLSPRERLLVARAVSQTVDFLLRHGFVTVRWPDGDCDDVSLDVSYLGDKALRELRAAAAALGSEPAKPA